MDPRGSGTSLRRIPPEIKLWWYVSLFCVASTKCFDVLHWAINLMMRHIIIPQNTTWLGLDKVTRWIKLVNLKFNFIKTILYESIRLISVTETKDTMEEDRKVSSSLGNTYYSLLTKLGFLHIAHTYTLLHQLCFWVQYQKCKYVQVDKKLHFASCSANSWVYDYI